MGVSTLLKTVAIAAIVTSMMPSMGQARGTLSLGQAVDKCTKRAIETGRRPFGRYGDNPPEYLVQTEYRACVYANSGQYPTAKVEYRESILTKLKDAF